MAREGPSSVGLGASGKEGMAHRARPLLIGLCIFTPAEGHSLRGGGQGRGLSAFCAARSCAVNATKRKFWINGVCFLGALQLWRRVLGRASPRVLRPSSLFVGQGPQSGPAEDPLVPVNE